MNKKHAFIFALTGFCTIFANTKLSVVIPVYKTASTLGRCVESVLKQEFSDMEIILVDDASPDECPRLCDLLAQEHASIRVIHQPHGGLSKARNTGIEAAGGEYITFVDSDDTVHPCTYATLMAVLRNHPDYDLLEFPVMAHYDSTRQTKLSLRRKEYTDMRTYWLDGMAYSHSYAWNKIYRAGLFTNVRFPEGRVFEDLFTLPQLLKHCRKVATTDLGMYYYYNNVYGITAQASGKDLQDLLYAHNLVLPEIADSTYYAHVVNIALDVYDATGNVPPLVNLPYSGTPKLIVKRFLGFKTLCLLHRIIHRSHS